MKKILVCGVGSLGSQLVSSLVPDLKGEHEITILDFDKVEERNLIGTQYYFPGQEDQLKTEALQYSIYKHFNREIKTINKQILDEYDAEIVFIPEELTGTDNQTTFDPYDLIIDCFDNSESRGNVQEACIKNKIPCLHIGFSDQFTFATEWAENYQVPSDITSGFDLCESEGASSFIKFVSALASQTILNYIKTGEKKEFIGNKFSVVEIK